MEDKLEESKHEIIKGNDIISKQQAEYKQLKQKLKLKQASTAQVEEQLLKKQTSIEDHNQTINDLKQGAIQS